MIIISTRELRDNQKKYFDMVDQNIQVIVQRGKDKSYALIPVQQKDRYLMDSSELNEIIQSLAQAKAGEVIKVKKEDLATFLGLE